MKKHNIYFFVFVFMTFLGACTVQGTVVSPTSGATKIPLAVTSTAQPIATPQGKDVEIILERTTCYGTCPSYRIIISDDGTVTYEGYKYVMVEGKQVSSISQEQITELLTEFEQIDFYSLPDYTTRHVTDMPYAILSLNIDSDAKTIKHYFGDPAAPKELFLLEKKIDEIVDSKQWIGDSAFEIVNYFQ